jgi:SAM-dependent methyltransferase
VRDFTYSGHELDLFAGAVHWKGYWRRELGHVVRGAVLEVGAGKGNNTCFLDDIECTCWVCVEPDRDLCAQLRARIRSGSRTKVICGTLADLTASSHFDTILYLDVLEHIQDHVSELRLAVAHLRPRGHLVVLAPAHQWLYSPFDEAVGHFRRYGRRSLCAAMPEDLLLVQIRYLDSAGLIASIGNRFILKRAMPTAKQVGFWDKRLVPISRLVDALTRYKVGKSILGVWQKRAN